MRRRGSGPKVVVSRGSGLVSLPKAGLLDPNEDPLASLSCRSIRSCRGSRSILYSRGTPPGGSRARHLERDSDAAHHH